VARIQSELRIGVHQNLARSLEGWSAPPQRAVAGFPCHPSTAGLERLRLERSFSF